MKKSKTKICPWRLVLNEILDYAPNFYDDEKRVMGIRCALRDYSHPLAEKLNISTDNLHDSLDFMEKIGLIEITDSSVPPPLHPIEITKKGFEVAEDYKKTKLSATLNLSLIFLTIMIFLTSACGFFNALGIMNPQYIFWLYVLSCSFAGILVYFSIIKKLE